MGKTPGNPQIVERALAAHPPSTTSKVLALGGVVVSIAFLANLTMGVVPLEIPDVLPFIGNLDEVFFSGVLIACLNHLGIPLIPNFRATTPPRDDVRVTGPE